jgi:hypothetical protein
MIKLLTAESGTRGLLRILALQEKVPGLKI